MLVLAGCAAAAPTPTETPSAVMVWPELEEVEPNEASPGEEVRVTGAGGYELTPSGGYDESLREFTLFFDGDPEGQIGCYVNRCEGTITVPSDSSLGVHEISVEGESRLAMMVREVVFIPIPHATGAGDVVVQVETRGGFAPEIINRTVNPDFTLYGDGMLVYRVHDEELGHSMLYRAVLTEEGVQEVLRRVVGEASFFDSLEFYGNPHVADAGTTRVTVETVEGCRSVRVYALGLGDLSEPPPGMTEEDVAQLARLAELYRGLLEFGEGVEGGELLVPETMHIFVDFAGGGVSQEAPPWPFPIIDLLFFASQLNPPAQVYLTDDLASEVYQFLIAADGSVFSHGEGVYSVAYRPHLPNEEQWRDRDLCTGARRLP